MSKKEADIFDFNKTLKKKSGKPKKKILKKAKEDKDEVVVMSTQQGGHEEVRDWLDKHGLDKAKLVQRGTKEHDHDPQVKERMLGKLSRQFKVKKAYDDKKANVKMFKRHGIKAKEV